MPVHTVRQGETIEFICWVWSVHYEILWRRSENSELVRTLLERDQQPDHHPGGMPGQLRAGDRVFIPDEYARRLPVAPGESVARMRRHWDHYLDVAHRNAFGRGVREMRWEPADGYSANRPILLRVYDYYRDTYNRNTRFLWAGLGRLAGGAVVNGLDTQVAATGEVRGFTDNLLRIAKAIFYDVAWLHEAVADNPQLGWVLACGYDARPQRIRFDGRPIPERYARARDSGVTVNAARFRSGFGRYGRAVRWIVRGDWEAVTYGNLALLATEQWINIQPWYDDIGRAGEGTMLSRGSAFARSVHPYHRDFLVDTHGDISLPRDRWRWIADVPNAMWPQWVALSEQERTRLVNLSFSDILARRFGTTLPQHQPPGTQY